MAIFDVISFPGLGLSRRVPAMRPLHLSFSNSPVLVLCEDLCLRFALFMSLRDSIRFSAGSRCRQRAFHLAIVVSNCFYLGVHRSSLFPGSNSSGSLCSSPENFELGVPKHSARIVFWRHFKVLCTWSGHKRQNGVYSMDFVSSRLKSPYLNAAALSPVDIATPLGG